MGTDQDKLPVEPKVLSIESKLSKHLTGVDYDQNPKECLEKITLKRQEVSIKYGLKLPEEFPSWREYATYLVNNAKERGVAISWVSQTRLNDEGHSAGIKKDGMLVMPEINLKDCSDIEAFNWAIKMGHEMVHTFQERNNFEDDEYEACAYSNLTMIKYLNERDYGELEGVKSYMTCNEFFVLVKGSVEYNYKKVGTDINSLEWANDKVE